jgi:hypothetical protein
MLRRGCWADGPLEECLKRNLVAHSDEVFGLPWTSPAEVTSNRRPNDRRGCETQGEPFQDMLSAMTLTYTVQKRRSRPSRR